MLTIYDSHHIPTNRQRKGARACRTHTGLFVGRGEIRRVRHEHVDLANRRLRLAWLARQWAGHQARIRYIQEKCA